MWKEGWEMGQTVTAKFLCTGGFHSEAGWGVSHALEQMECLLNFCHCVRVQSFQRYSRPRRTNDLLKEKDFQYSIIRTMW